MRALLHTFLGAYLVIALGRTKLQRIHVHHGYFGCWIAMTAARLLEVPYSVTLHGSDLLLHKAFLETKLKHCQFCATSSDFNRRHILERYPNIDPRKIFVRRYGVESQQAWLKEIKQSALIMLAVGRLHKVKNHAFLIDACAHLKQRDRSFACLIAGDGPERLSLQRLIQERKLDYEVALLGHLSQPGLDRFYSTANLVILTSRSEGIPIALMEAMARGKIVLAPDITGISELVADADTGFLFQEGSIHGFLAALDRISNSSPQFLARVRERARQRISKQYDRETNLAAFADLLLEQAKLDEVIPHENFVLQQV